MKTIIYTLGIVALVLTFSSCSADELPENTKPQFTTVANAAIDPPVSADRPR